MTAKPETLVARIEREIRALIAAFARNRKMGAAIASVLLLIVAWRVGWIPQLREVADPPGPAEFQAAPVLTGMCRYLVIESGVDNLFGCNKTVTVTIDGEIFWFSPCTRSALLFALKSYDSGSAIFAINSTWPDEGNALSSIGHSFSGRLSFPGTGYYGVAPQGTPGFANSPIINNIITPTELSANEFARIIARNELEVPTAAACSSYDQPVTLVGGYPLTWRGYRDLGVAFVIVAAIALGVIALVRRLWRRRQAPV